MPDDRWVPPVVMMLRDRTAATRAHWLRWAAVVILLALAAAVGVDRAAAALAGRALAGRVQLAEGVTCRPRVTVHGFPFLTQVLTGRYREVDLACSDLTSQGDHITRAGVRLRGVRVHPGQVLRGQVRAVPVQGGAGTAQLSFTDLTGLLHHHGGALGAQLTVSAAGPGRLTVRGPLGLSVTTAAAVVNGQLILTPDQAALPGPARTLLGRVTGTPLPLPALPFGARLTTGTVGPDGVSLLATANNAVLRTG